MTKIGPYEILETLHLGPQPLFRAKAPDGQIIALKASPVAALTSETRERFLREAQTCRELNHPNVTRVFDAGEADGMLYQAMELLEGADLSKVEAEGRRFTWDEKLSIMEQVCEGLNYAHERRIVHRDIKPANLFLENSGRVRILDFGMVRVAESQLTKIGSSLGTLNYMSPEQIRGERCTTASDVFSAGIVFFQLASGRHPFSTRDRNLGQVVSAIVFEAPPRLTELRPDAPEGLEFILNRALEKDAAKRLQTAGHLKHALELCRMTRDMGVPAAPPPPTDPGTPAARVHDGEKTRVMVRPGAAPEMDFDKTRVIQRPAPVPHPPHAPHATPAPLPPPIAALPRAPGAQGAPALQFRYCPACTFANAPGAAVCVRCQNPLPGGGGAATARAPLQWSLYIAIGVAVALAIALIVVLVGK